MFCRNCGQQITDVLAWYRGRHILTNLAGDRRCPGRVSLPGTAEEHVRDYKMTEDAAAALRARVDQREAERTVRARAHGILREAFGPDDETRQVSVEG